MERVKAFQNYWEQQKIIDDIRTDACDIAHLAKELMDNHGASYYKVKEIVSEEVEKAMAIFCPNPDNKGTIKFRKWAEIKEKK